LSHAFMRIRLILHREMVSQLHTSERALPRRIGALRGLESNGEGQDSARADHPGGGGRRLDAGRAPAVHTPMARGRALAWASKLPDALPPRTRGGEPALQRDHPPHYADRRAPRGGEGITTALS
jgi:hypothetical protein